MIQSGLCDVVLTGSADSSLNRVDVQGFCSIMALSENAEPVEYGQPLFAIRPA